MEYFGVRAEEFRDVEVSLEWGVNAVLGPGKPEAAAGRIKKLVELLAVEPELSSRIIRSAINAGIEIDICSEEAGKEILRQLGLHTDAENKK
jgi:hypothetical protein